MDNRYSGEERRKFQRARVSFIVIYRVNEPMHVSILVGNREVNAIMADLSEGGMSLLTNYDIPVQTKVSAKFILLNERSLRQTDRVKTIEVAGEVRYNRFLKDRSYKLGVYFTNITESDQEFIREFIRWVPKEGM